MTDQERDEIRMMIDQVITARIGNVAIASTSTNIPCNVTISTYQPPINEPCVSYIMGGIKAYMCSTVCAGLPNCALKGSITKQE